MHTNLNPGNPILFTQPNFRDIGGIPAQDGKFTRHGLVYRSGDLSNLTVRDKFTLEKLNIRMIIDFRSDTEVSTHPTPEIRSVEELRRIVLLDSSLTMAEKMLQENDAEGLANLLLKDYRRLVNDHHADFREFFTVLSETDKFPLVFHCAAGKDRTGLATYLLLRALGIDDRVARNDYLVSNILLKPLADKIIGDVSRTGKNGEILRPLLETRESYLDAALDEMERKFGGLEKYLVRELNVEKRQLRTKFLT